MDLSKFTGIHEYSDSADVSVYENLIPIGDKVLDRLGEDNISSTAFLAYAAQRLYITGFFVDSYNYVWFASANIIYRINIADALVSNNDGGDDNDIRGQSVLGRTGDESTFENLLICETSDKVIFIYNNQKKQFYTCELTRLPDATVNIIDITDYVIMRPEMHGWPIPTEGSTFTSMIYYEDRLILTRPETNEFLVSTWDPYNKIKTITEPTNPNNTPNPDFMWVDAITSTLGDSGMIDKCISYNGNVYVFYDKRVECWSRTGDRDVPIRINPQATVYVGGKLPIILDNVLFFIGLDPTKSQHVWTINPDNSSKQISNPVIEKLFTDNIIDISFMHEREHTHLLIYQDRGADTYKEAICYNKTHDTWFTWTNKNAKGNSICYRTVQGDFGLTINAQPFRWNKNHRRLFDSENIIKRRLVDFFQTFDRRVITRLVEIVCDTSIGETNNAELKCRVITNRGQIDNPQYKAIRRTGIENQNNKSIQFRNMGSGNSFLLDILCDSDINLQIYKIILELQ